jgi:hypothetical protein
VNGALRLYLIAKTWVSLPAYADGLRSDSEKGLGCRLEFRFAEQTSRACFIPHGQVCGPGDACNTKCSQLLLIILPALKRVFSNLQLRLKSLTPFVVLFSGPSTNDTHGLIRFESKI